MVLNREVIPEDFANSQPEVIIVATGAETAPLNLPGGNRALSAAEALSGCRPIGERVLLLGAGFVGCELGWHLAHAGHRVQLVDVLPEEKLLADEHPLNRATLFHQMTRAGVTLTCSAAPLEITDQGVVVSRSDGEKQLLAADSIVTCFGLRPDRKLYDRLRGPDNRWDVYPVGDCVKVENFFHAVQSAFQLACGI